MLGEEQLGLIILQPHRIILDKINHSHSGPASIAFNNADPLCTGSAATRWAMR